MKKRITFYGTTVELELNAVTSKRVERYIRRKLNDTTYYIQKKRDGSYMFYYEAQPADHVPAGYYYCEFHIDEIVETE